MLPERKYTLMQPLQHKLRNAQCPTCERELIGREWRVRNSNGYGDSWHPRCFATAWPSIDIDEPAETPIEVSKMIRDTQQHNRNTNMPTTGTNQETQRIELNTPENPIRHIGLPSLHELENVGWDEILEYTSTAKRLPPQCHAMYIQLIHDTCKHINANINQNNSMEVDNGLKLLEAIPRMVLANMHKHRGGKKGQGNASFTKTVRQRIDLIYKSKWDELLSQPDLGPKRTKTNQRQHQLQQRDQQDVKNIIQHLQDNELHEALRIFNGPPQLACPEQIRRELPSLFKNDCTAVPLPANIALDSQHVQCIRDNIKKIITHHPKHRGPGPAGERYEHYGIVSKNEAALESLTETLTHIACNNIPSTALNAIASARLIPLMKPNGKIRPIACGTVMRRIVTAAIARHIAPIISYTIGSHQYAIAKQNGAEELHKLVQTLLDHDRQTGLLSIDVEAAFADIEPAAILDAIQKHHGDLEPFIRHFILAEALYQCNLPNEEVLTLKSKRGVPMGCPLAAAAFALTLHTALSQTHVEMTQTDQSTTILAYMDDINILTKHQNHPMALQTVRHNLRNIGLKLNDSKTECWIDASVAAPSTHYQGILRAKRPTVLKTTAEPMPPVPESQTDTAPYLHEDAPELQRLINKRRNIATRLRQLQKQGLPIHIAQALWRTATAGDATFTARTVGLNLSTATALDQMTLELWSEWLHEAPTKEDAARIFSSITNEGFGFTAATHIKDAALIASWSQVAPSILKRMGKQSMRDLLAELPLTSLQLKRAVGNIDPALMPELLNITADSVIPRHQQKKLAAIPRKYDTVIATSTLSAEDMSIYLSTGGKGAGAWLHAPVDEIKPMTDEHFTIAAKLRLNKQQVENPTICQRRTEANTCNRPVNSKMHHVLQCPYGPYRNQRHNAVRDTLARLIERITGQQPLIEQMLVTQCQPTNTAHSDDDKTTSNRADVTWFTAAGPVHLDVMITSAFTQTALAGINATSVVPGTANAHAELYKKRKYAPHPVTPIVFEAHGRFGNETISFLQKLTATLPEPEQTQMLHYAIQILSTTIQKHNAQTIEAHIKHHVNPHARTATA